MKLNPDDVEAILESREHWRRMRANARGVYDRTHELPGRRNCPLCEKYNYSECVDKDGGRCPIARSVRDLCTGTPYAAALKAWFDYVEKRRNSARETWERAADAEIAFLEGLLDDADFAVS